MRLGERFDPEQAAEFRHVFYTGPIDAFFAHQHGRLNYRTVTFERIDGIGDLQGNAIINYTELAVPFTRIHEHKHFTPWETHERTVAFAEFSQATSPEDMPCYPVRRPADKQALNTYYRMVSETRGVSFLGRLATYRYLDMDSVIGESLDFAKVFLRQDAASRPAYPRVTPAVAAAIVQHTGISL